MIAAALDAEVTAGWVAGDEVYGADPTLLTTVEDRGVGYVLAVAANRRIRSATPRIGSTNSPKRYLPGRFTYAASTPPANTPTT